MHSVIYADRLQYVLKRYDGFSVIGSADGRTDIGKLIAWEERPRRVLRMDFRVVKESDQ